MRRVESKNFCLDEGAGLLELIRYFPYQEPKGIRVEPRRYDEFEKEFFEMEKQREKNYFDDEDMNWSDLMNRRVISGFLSCKDLVELKGNLERIYTLRNRRF